MAAQGVRLGLLWLAAWAASTAGLATIWAPLTVGLLSLGVLFGGGAALLTWQSVHEARKKIREGSEL